MIKINGEPGLHFLKYLYYIFIINIYIFTKHNINTLFFRTHFNLQTTLDLTDEKINKYKDI